MIRINLLPHREEGRKARQKQFVTLAVLSALIGAGISALIWAFLNTQIDTNKDRNKYLTAETAKLEKQIDEIKRIREETASLLAKKQVVENLQSNRSDPVHLLDQMLRQLPEGLYLKSIKQTGNKINVSGYAQSNARVATFMENINASPYHENANLIVIKAVDVDKQRANEFIVDFGIERPKVEDNKAGKSKAAATKPAEKKP